MKTQTVENEWELWFSWSTRRQARAFSAIAKPPPEKVIRACLSGASYRKITALLANHRASVSAEQMLNAFRERGKDLVPFMHLFFANKYIRHAESEAYMTLYQDVRFKDCLMRYMNDLYASYGHACIYNDEVVEKMMDALPKEERKEMLKWMKEQTTTVSHLFAANHAPDGIATDLVYQEPVEASSWLNWLKAIPQKGARSVMVNKWISEIQACETDLSDAARGLMWDWLKSKNVSKRGDAIWFLWERFETLDHTGKEAFEHHLQQEKNTYAFASVCHQFEYGGPEERENRKAFIDAIAKNKPLDERWLPFHLMCLSKMSIEEKIKEQSYREEIKKAIVSVAALHPMRFFVLALEYARILSVKDNEIMMPEEFIQPLIDYVVSLETRELRPHIQAQCESIIDLGVAYCELRPSIRRSELEVLLPAIVAIGERTQLATSFVRADEARSQKVRKVL
jgi:hypothetical protein